MRPVSLRLRHDGLPATSARVGNCVLDGQCCTFIPGGLEVTLPQGFSNSSEPEFMIGVHCLESGPPRLQSPRSGRAEKAGRLLVATRIAGDIGEAFKRVRDCHVAM